MAVAALVVAVLALLVAVASAGYTRTQAVATKQTAELEGLRRHDEMTPHLRISAVPANPGSDNLRMTVRLLGPASLERLDGLTVWIRDDNPARAEGQPLAGGPTKEQVARQIWGSYRFVRGTGPGANDPTRSDLGADPTGRTTHTDGMAVGEDLVFALEPTPPPSWTSWSPADWGREMGHTIRLRFECSSKRHAPWRGLTCEVGVGDPPVEI